MAIRRTYGAGEDTVEWRWTTDDGAGITAIFSTPAGGGAATGFMTTNTGYWGSI